MEKPFLPLPRCLPLCQPRPEPPGAGWVLVPCAQASPWGRVCFCHADGALVGCGVWYELGGGHGRWVPLCAALRSLGVPGGTVAGNGDGQRRRDGGRGGDRDWK